MTQAGLLDDIINQLSTPSVPAVPIPGVAVQPAAPVVGLPIQGGYVQSVPSFGYGVPAMQPSVEDDISALWRRLLQLGPAELSHTNDLLRNLVQAVGQRLQALGVPFTQQQLQFQSGQTSQNPRQEPLFTKLEEALPSGVQAPGQAVSGALALGALGNKLQAAPRSPEGFKYPRASAANGFEEQMQGIYASKVIKAVGEQQKRAFWIQDAPTGHKIFWAEHPEEQAQGSFGLANAKYVLVGNLSQEFVRCKLDFLSCAQLRPKLYYGQAMPLQMTLLSEKRDLTIRFGSPEELEAWAATVVRLSGCPVFVE